MKCKSGLIVELQDATPETLLHIVELTLLMIMILTQWNVTLVNGLAIELTE